MSKLITITDSRSPAAEAYQSLRTNIEFAGLDQPLQSLLVTCADTNTNKSQALANLAVVMAGAGDKVIVVDGDLRRPQQHEIFDLHNQEGLTSWLQGNSSAPPIQSTAIEGLRVLPAGPSHPNPVALLSAKRLSEALAELSQQTDYLLCDSPPLLAVTDAALWASKVDGTILLLNAGGTKRDQAQQAKAVLAKVRARIIGAVLLNSEEDVNSLRYG
ncbi:MAG: CpsD/CapB family tyrosine-protein kinase [Chloroflexota bacterium]